MSYTCYLDGTEMPTPSKLTVKIKGKNKTLILLNEGEINFLRQPGLTDLVVPFVFPMLTGDHTPDFYLGILESPTAGQQRLLDQRLNQPLEQLSRDGALPAEKLGAHRRLIAQPLLDGTGQIQQLPLLLGRERGGRRRLRQ